MRSNMTRSVLAVSLAALAFLAWIVLAVLFGEGPSVGWLMMHEL